MTNFWFEPYKLYKNIFHSSCIPHFLRRLLIAALTLACCLGIEYIFSFFPPVNTVQLLLKGVIVAIIPNVVFFIVYHRTEEFKFIVSKLKPFIQDKLKAVLSRQK